MNSPVEYYGGKTYMTDILQQFFPSTYRLYIEGFGGGASLLLNKPRTPLEIYNDLEKNIYSLFKVIQDENLFKQLQDKLSLTPYMHELRDEYKEKLKDNSISLLDRAYYFFYVNRTSFNGVGGFSFNPLVRRNMSKSVSGYLSAIENLTEIHNRIYSAVIENRDIFELIDKYDAEDVFFYLDPPYVQSTRKSNQRYLVEMEDELHIKLIERLKLVKGKVLLSGYDNPMYDELVKAGWNKYSFVSRNSASEAIETIWYNYDVDNKENLFE